MKQRLGRAGDRIYAFRVNSSTVLFSSSASASSFSPTSATRHAFRLM